MADQNKKRPILTDKEETDLPRAKPLVAPDLKNYQPKLIPTVEPVTTIQTKTG